ncbi:DUF4917 family protein [Corallococcus sp. ZKHCc1 1396]|uniref:DUF4917 family protein n=1 Tax=Corallococcus soli TaxID=2710757 RepID=A0ABR9PJ40_9BACT|nr:DUF4917 family protein [Corallococcus soli]MBE4747914.1 DUF4917 family protein [Corallococcus soli]
MTQQAPNVPAEILKFSEIAQDYKRHALFGNGFSIAISRNFGYHTLKEEALARGQLTVQEAALFDAFGTVNFELVLNRLYDASMVNGALQIQDNNLPLARYDVIRNALIKTVKDIHPSFSDFDLKWAARAAQHLQSYESVFTTNYDLTLYWIMGQVEFAGFTDFFWSDGPTFDQFNTEVWGPRAKVYYLHGALFLFRDKESSRIFKLKSSYYQGLLDSIAATMLGANIPLFISEGTHQQKLAAIYREPYLSHCYGALRKCRGGMVIFGSSLGEADEHLVDAIGASGLNKVACSIYVGNRTKDELNDEISYIKYRLRRVLNRGGDLLFFDSTTAPLSYGYEDP